MRDRLALPVDDGVAHAREAISQVEKVCVAVLMPYVSEGLEIGKGLIDLCVAEGHEQVDV